MPRRLLFAAFALLAAACDQGDWHVIVEINGLGTVTATPSRADNSHCAGDLGTHVQCDLNRADDNGITLTAEPAGSWVFDHWESLSTDGPHTAACAIADPKNPALKIFHELSGADDHSTSCLAVFTPAIVPTKTIDITVSRGSTYLAGSMSSYTPPPGEQTTRKTDGPCTIADSVLGSGTGTTELFDSGTLTASGTAGQITATQNPSTKVYFAISQEDLFPAGAVITLSSTGGTAPALPSTDLTAGSDVRFTKLVAHQSSVSRTSPLEFAWLDGGEGDVVVRMIQQLHVVTCRFPAKGGAGAVPTSVLATFAAGSAQVDLDNTNVKKLDVGAFRATLSHRSKVRTEAGGPVYAAQITLQ